ncbi:hypothetical protein Q8F55_001900 [Vanrija albida]|uniref:SET domain-containing protein n=1 Tax=Vanrija albida TaxID=181172 RepID=A0ABR3Q8X6_9TREE
MVDTTGDKALAALLDWLNTFPGFHNKGVLKFANHGGRGLFVDQAVQPSENLLVIPAPSLLNPLTLQKSALNTIPPELFPVAASSSSPPRRSSNGTPRLTTTQLLTLHNALTRDPKQRHKSEWQVFMDSLPGFRPWHPLTWVIPSSDDAEQDEWWTRLYECLSESVKIKIAEVKKRYEDDRAVVRNVLANEEPFRSQGIDKELSDEVILWAWLNVNTRTVSMPLGLAEPVDAKWPVNNHSFIPLLDMINHSSLNSVVCPKPESLPSSSVSKRVVKTARGPGRQLNAHLIPGKIDQAVFAPLRGLEAGEEVMFMYGPHSNALLFAEYGFTEVDDASDPLQWPNGDIDVSPWVYKLWEDGGGTDDKRDVLDDAGLWGHNKLLSNSGEPAPSIGLMSTLCVLHSSLESNITVDTLRTRNFSRTTKMAARRALARICEAVLSDAADAREDLDEIAPLASDDAKRQAVRTSRALLREEEHIAKGVLELVETGGSIPSF